MGAEKIRGKARQHYSVGGGTDRLSVDRVDRLLNVTSADRINSQAIRNLIFSEVFQESSDGIYVVANLLRGGSSLDRQKRKEFREKGREIAASTINELYPDISADYINAWIDGGDSDDWLERAEVNREMMVNLNEFKYDSAKTLTTLFGIRNFHRFSLDHWKKQYNDQFDQDKSHVPFFMSVFDDTDQHLHSASVIESVEAANPSLALRVYEWDTPRQLSDHLYFSQNYYGAAKRNTYIISHGDSKGLDGGFDRSTGRVDIFNLDRSNLAFNAGLATDPQANIVIVACRAGSILDFDTAEEFGEESFAQRMASYSGRTVIASDMPIGLKNLEFEDGDNQSRIIPVFNSPYESAEVRGRRFKPIPPKKAWSL